MSDLSDILAYLDQVKATTDAASKGPWVDFAGVLRTETKLVGINSRACKTAEESADSAFMRASRQRIPQTGAGAEGCGGGVGITIRRPAP